MEPTPWWKDPKQLVTIITAIFAGIATWQASCANQNTTRTGQKMDAVVVKQDEQIMKAEVMKNEIDSLHQKATVIDNKAAVIDSKLPKK